VIDAGARVFEGQAGLGVPQGLARFCSGPVWSEAALLTSLYHAACSRSALMWPSVQRLYNEVAIVVA
jgi:hypothetical protein